jgi:hypothetical protein
MKAALAFALFPLMALAQDTAASRATPPKAEVIEPAESISSLLQARRVYVEPLTGGSSAEAIRQLLIGSLQQSHLFVLTDNPDRADAIVRGAADDKEFTDQFDSQEGLNAHMNAGSFAGSSSSTGRGAGGYGGVTVGENESHHTKERKHEAFAAVRLCNRDGDVLWATTQESRGAKFRGASADVADKVARQMRLDFDQALRAIQTGGAPSAVQPAVRP